VFSLAYVLRYFWKVFLETPKTQREDIKDPHIYMVIAMIVLAAFVVILGIYPGVFIDLIHAVTSI
jgi:NADH:ubiquinone oxidoreductase subunit 4 (subunit M)